MNLSNAAILDKGFDYHRIFSIISEKWDYKLNAKFWFDWKKWNVIKKSGKWWIKKNCINIFESIYKVEKNIMKFGDIEIQKQKFYQHKGIILIKNIDIKK